MNSQLPHAKKGPDEYIFDMTILCKLVISLQDLVYLVIIL